MNESGLLASCLAAMIGIESAYFQKHQPAGSQQLNGTEKGGGGKCLKKSSRTRIASPGMFPSSTRAFAVRVQWDQCSQCEWMVSPRLPHAQLCPYWPFSQSMEGSPTPLPLLTKIQMFSHSVLLLQGVLSIIISQLFPSLFKCENPV